MIEPILLTWERKTRADLAATWAALSDTDRFNRIAGLDFHFALDPKSVGRADATGQMRHLGLKVSWRELPVRFDAPHNYLIEREYDAGPVTRSQTELRLTEEANGTRVFFETRLWSRSRLFRPAVRLDAELTVRPKLEKALDIIVAALDAEHEIVDVPGGALTAAGEACLQAALAQLGDPQVAAKLGAHLRTAPLVEQVRMRPLALAKRWGLPEKQVTAGMLRAVQAGALVLQWEVICPSCKLPTASSQSLDLQGVTQHCAACDVRYDASFADAVALTCKTAPQVRARLGKIDCLSSPARMPHIVGQTVLGARGEVDWTLDLLPGIYHLRGWPQLDQITLVVRQGLPRRRQVILAGPKALSPPAVRLGAGRVTLTVRSKLDELLTLVVERPWVEPGTLTVGRLLEWPELAALLPRNSLQAGLAISPFVGFVLAVQVVRGGGMAQQRVGEVVAAAGARALQVSTGWVLATLPDAPALSRAVGPLVGAPWLSAAVGYGAVVELASEAQRIASGALLQDLVSLAQGAEPGQVLATRPEAWPAQLDGGRWVTAPDGNSELALDGPRGPLALPTLPNQPLGTGDLVDGRFALGDQLGKGGFGVVFAAEDQLTKQQVVVKLLRSELADDPSQVQRFFDEGRLSSRLRHPCVVDVLEWGLSDDGRLFMAMERLQGRELADLLSELGTLDPARSAQLCAQALSGLAEAHRQGLVHRDIKPANLFVVDEGTPEERCKVIDFGIALDLTGQVRSSEQAGTVMGTPLYMSPEQVRGEVLDGRCDLYAIGIVLFQALTGGLPFVGDTALSVLVARLTEPPRRLEALCSQPIPTGLGDLVARALTVDRSARPATAEDMARELQAIVQSAGDSHRWRETWQAHRARPDAGLDLMSADTVWDGQAESTPGAMVPRFLAAVETGKSQAQPGDQPRSSE